MAKGKTWYERGHAEAMRGLPSDPPYQPGHRSHTDYVEGYADGELQAERAEALALPCDRLFNCCTDWREPDWTGFVSLRLGGCKDDDGETEGLVCASEADFFTVYGIDADGMGEAITDSGHLNETGAPKGSGLDDARAVLAELSARSGLPGHECAFLNAAESAGGARG